MAAAGLATAAVAPLVLGQQPAGAAETNASDQDSITFQAFGGATVECTVHLTAGHSTANPEQPRVDWSTSMGGDPACRDDFELFTTVRYEDEGGTTRTAQFTSESLSFGSINGAYTGTSVTTLFRFVNCDPDPSAGCDVTLTASPK